MPYLAEDLVLYYARSCGFCMRVLGEMRRLDVTMELRNLSENALYHQELVQGGGKGMIPCLRITAADGGVRWMYESADIAAYLARRFGENQGKNAVG